ncbi:ABC transporter ATP-binding protein [Pseudophaeobacter flagellatus]|uniref:ABC transporter ATP-binding protein n=1 Tax=Pseudophaeobacter flagellatus TaxID=2899119 RepID=UPI001E52B251|nr:ABC transporter ATP-binding protein [Pseudophaeobacter flagellatus]MCD9148826.1 ABC transporter ATP-binding protein [Pseudophaeobacter flagellatus]
MSLLKVQGLNASYGPSQALFGVDLCLEEGEVLALMGRNGMGKSTTIKVICGMLAASAGELEFAGADLRQMKSHRIARLGIGLVPEGRRCFAPLTVEENLTAAARPGEWTFDKVAALFPRLAERRSQKAASLSGGEQQMLAIGRALMTNPRLLILDEATEGLAPVVRQEIWAAIAQLKSQTGMAILVVDKTLKELAQVADKAVILNKGQTVWAGDMQALTPDLTDRFLGV